jgi:hypothetical protein
LSQITSDAAGKPDQLICFFVSRSWSFSIYW